MPTLLRVEPEPDPPHVHWMARYYHCPTCRCAFVVDAGELGTPEAVVVDDDGPVPFGYVTCPNPKCGVKTRVERHYEHPHAVFVRENPGAVEVPALPVDVLIVWGGSRGEDRRGRA